MNHASNLKWHTMCGRLNKALPEGDSSYAALNESTQAWVDCDECRAKLGLEPLTNDKRTL